MSIGGHKVAALARPALSSTMRRFRADVNYQECNDEESHESDSDNEEDYAEEPCRVRLTRVKVA